MTDYQLICWRIMLALFWLHAIAMVFYWITDKLPYWRCVQIALAIFVVLATGYGAFKYNLL